jgi:hypothetical protein
MMVSGISETKSTDKEVVMNRPIYAHILDVIHGYTSIVDLYNVARALPVARSRRLIREAHQYGVISHARMVSWLAVITE